MDVARGRADVGVARSRRAARAGSRRADPRAGAGRAARARRRGGAAPSSFACSTPASRRPSRRPSRPPSRSSPGAAWAGCSPRRQEARRRRGAASCRTGSGRSTNRRGRSATCGASDTSRIAKTTARSARGRLEKLMASAQAPQSDGASAWRAPCSMRHAHARPRLCRRSSCSPVVTSTSDGGDDELRRSAALTGPGHDAGRVSQSRRPASASDRRPRRLRRLRAVRAPTTPPMAHPPQDWGAVLRGVRLRSTRPRASTRRAASAAYDANSADRRAGPAGFLGLLGDRRPRARPTAAAPASTRSSARATTTAPRSTYDTHRTAASSTRSRTAGRERQRQGCYVDHDCGASAALHRVGDERVHPAAGLRRRARTARRCAAGRCISAENSLRRDRLRSERALRATCSAGLVRRPDVLADACRTRRARTIDCRPGYECVETCQAPNRWPEHPGLRHLRRAVRPRIRRDLRELTTENACRRPRRLHAGLHRRGLHLLPGRLHVQDPDVRALPVN